MHIEELARLLQNLIRLGTVSQVQCADPPRVRVKTGQLQTNWLVWLETRAGSTRTWNPPTVGEQVVHYPDGATYAYDHAAGQLTVSGVKSLIVDCQEAVINCSDWLQINCPQNTVNGKLTVTGALTYQSGMTGSSGAGGATVITGDIIHKQGDYTHSGGALSSNGVVLDKHTHSGVTPGDSNTGEPK